MLQEKFTTVQKFTIAIFKSCICKLFYAFKVCWVGINRGISAHCITMLFWTTGNVAFYPSKTRTLLKFPLSYIKRASWCS